MPQNVSQMAYGAFSIVKSAVGIGLAESFVIGQRRDICHKCEFLNKGIIAQCSKCGCVVTEKTMRQEERCPINKW